VSTGRSPPPCRPAGSTGAGSTRRPVDRCLVNPPGIPYAARYTLEVAHEPQI
jgi:hypothetical protein